MRYDAYAQQRIIKKLFDLQNQYQDLNWSVMADKITLWRGVSFQRMNFYRLQKNRLNDETTNIIVDWITDQFDPDFPEKLSPGSIFSEFGTSSRDYYYHIPAPNIVDEWDEQILERFSGVYLCAPANDGNSYLPSTFLRKFFENRKSFSHIDEKGRSLDIKQFINERSILILQRTSGSYFHAAEFPMSLLFPRSFETLDIRMVYEGVGVASSNSFNVTLRECLSRVPKTHSMLISSKNHNQLNNPYGLSIYLPPGKERAREEWKHLASSERDHMREEFADPIEADYYLSGSAQISVAPVPYLKNKVDTTFPQELVYYKKPSDFLRNKNLHFIKPELENTEEIRKLVESPLSIGELI